MMKKICLMGISWAIVFGVAAAFGNTAAVQTEPILEKIVSHYEKPCFSAYFFQETVLQAMDITDTAFGRIHVQQPDKMRWEYEKPEKQTIVTDGRTLWIYRPADRQVMVGRAPNFLTNGKGAGFLSDLQQLENNFFITCAPETEPGYDRLKLVPRRPMGDVEAVYLWADKSTGQIDKIVIHNAYGDENRIELSRYVFTDRRQEDRFKFDIPDGVDVVELDENTF